MCNETCVFCKITENKIPSFTLYEDGDFKVILDKFPAALGHAIVIVKGHYENIFELPYDKAEKVFPVVKKIALALEATTGCGGLNILQNNGLEAGQTVMHFHIHLLPRFDDDKINITWSQLGMENAGFETFKKAFLEKFNG